MKVFIFTALSILLVAFSAQAADGIVNVQSAFSARETADRLERLLSDKGMTIVSRVKHSEAAGKAGIDLRHTELIIFGNPAAGSPLMKCQQSVAIDLPQKALVWEDDQGKVWISYNDPGYLKKRHEISGCEEVLSKTEKALAGIAQSAATK
ncbi:MAG: DUF302 domain-containing protein [Desulfobacteraceae bacterium]|nr:MAG: DUF302 domain-containing protein [Desulfobacteraceae bacterium]